MDDREHELRDLAEDCTDRSGVLDAWVAKSFTDMLLVVEVPEGESLPASLAATIESAGLVGYNELHDVSAPDPASAGGLPDRDRFRFVDVELRGTQQSYVVE